MAVTWIICLAVPLEILLLYKAAMHLFDIIYPGKKKKNRSLGKQNGKHVSAEDFRKYQKLL